jgi:hypothetical protein
MSLAPSHRRPARRRAPSFDGLEDRLLLAATQQSLAYRVAQVQHKYHQYVSDLQRVELGSHATPAESLALRDAARSIGVAAATADLPPQVARARALAVTLQLDRAPLLGWLGDRGWEDMRARLTADLDALGVPPQVADQAIAAMQAVARSAGVTADEYRDLIAKEDSYRDGRDALPSGAADLPDPNVYYTQHLRGFFRGGEAQRRADLAKLDTDIRSIGATAGDTPAEASVLRRDTRLLERIGASVTSQADVGLGDAFVAAFALGAPSGQDLTDLEGTIRSIVGAGGIAITLGAVDRLVGDADAFFRATGSSRDGVRILTDDVRSVVEDGGGSPPNPFKVQIGRGLPATPEQPARFGPGEAP